MEKINPFWFKLEPQHIENNLSQAILYLTLAYRDPTTRDGKFEETVSLLFRLADSTVPEGTQKAFQIYGSALLSSFGRANHERTLRYLLGLYECLTLAVPKTAPLFLKSAVSAFCASELIHPGLTWSDVITGKLDELTATRIATSLTTSGTTREAWYEGQGTLHVTGGRIEILPCNRDDARGLNLRPVLSLQETGIDALADKKDKLRTGADALKWFLSDQANMRPAQRASLLHYSVGDTVPVRYTGVDRNGNMTVQSVDPSYKTLSGVIRLDARGTHLYRTEDIADYLDKGAVIPVTYDKDDQIAKFSFKDTLFDHITGSLRHEEMNAICKGNAKGQTTWWTEKGFMAFTPGREPYQTGDVARVWISDWNDRGSIRCEVVSPDGEPFTEGDSRRRMMRSFTIPEEQLPKGKDRNADLMDETRAAGILGRLLLAGSDYRELLTERTKLADAALLLSRFASDGAGETACRRMLRHLENLRCFASGDYGQIEPWEGAETGEDEKTDALLALFAGEPVRSGPVDTNKAVAGLVQAALELRDNGLSVPLKHVKQEICRLLGIQTLEETNEDTDYNFGAESGTQEFKTSVFFAPENAREQDQKKTIQRVVCAFLNAPLGGTLYLGVDDNGYPVGLTQDIEHMEKHVKGAYEGMDGYLRYLRLLLGEAFPQEVWSTLTVEPILDGQAVAVRIPPYPDGVVSLDGTAWYRFGSECIKIDAQFRKKLDKRKRRS